MRRPGREMAALAQTSIIYFIIDVYNILYYIILYYIIESGAQRLHQHVQGDVCASAAISLPFPLSTSARALPLASARARPFPVHLFKALKRIFSTMRSAIRASARARRAGGLLLG